MSEFRKDGILAKCKKLKWFRTNFGNLLGNKENVNEEECKIGFTLAVGVEPSDWEIEMVSKQKIMAYSHFEELIYKKLFLRNDDHLVNLFRSLDCDSKGYITLSDVETAWKAVAPHMQNSFLWEAFNELSFNGKMDFDSFKNISLFM